jgi:hypothetical protein
MPMHVTFVCSRCEALNRSELAGPPGTLGCASCGHELAPRGTAPRDDRIAECVLCGTPDLYVQKDFPHTLGLSIVAACILLSSVALFLHRSLLALGIILASLPLDAAIYYLVGDITICYRCLAQYRGVRRNPEQRAFDLGVGERYRQERIRLDMLRRSAEASNPVGK